jgi:integrase
MKRHSSRPRKRILNDDEIRALWANAEGTFGDIVKLALLTAQRKAKLVGMKWNDLRNDEWIIPTFAREKGNPGQLKLPKLAIEIIRARPQIAQNEFVFAGRGKAAFNSWSEQKGALDAKLKEALGQLERWTIHDLRRTARSLLSRAGVLPHVAEQVLGHVQAGIVAVYDRHTYDVEKANALQRLAELLQSILKCEKETIPFNQAIPVENAQGKEVVL